MKCDQPDDRPRTAVMGAGNLLMSDDGVGVHVIQVLRTKQGLPGDVKLIDAGTAALDVLQFLDDIDRLIIVDAVKGGGPPGTIYQFSPEDVSEEPSRRLSLHQISLFQALNTRKMLGSTLPGLVIIGVEPKSISPGTSLSPEVQAAVDKVVDTIVALVG